MKGDKLLIALMISAGVFSLLLYRAVVKSPIVKEARPTKEARSSQQSPFLEQFANTEMPAEFQKEVSPKVKTKEVDKQGPFQDTEDLTPEETKRIFEEEMRAHIPPDMSAEEAFRKSMNMDRTEKMSESEKEEAFYRSLGGQQDLSEEERRALFEESMGIGMGE